MRRCLVIGNWKMHGSQSQVAELLAGVKARPAASAEVAVCPPYVYLSQAAQILQDSGISWGAQNLSDQQQGAFTGEVSGDMLADIGCRFVIVGHSERRSLYGETDAVIASKFEQAQVSGLIPILCVGESLAQREAGQALQVVDQQLTAVIEQAGIDAFSKAVIAYEPVWAIGTGQTASPEQAQEVHAYIRERLAQASDVVAGQISILYGGSVKAANAAELFAKADIDGALVGGASLQADEFAEIYNAV